MLVIVCNREQFVTFLVRSQNYSALPDSPIVEPCLFERAAPSILARPPSPLANQDGGCTRSKRLAIPRIYLPLGVETLWKRAFRLHNGDAHVGRESRLYSEDRENNP